MVLVMGIIKFYGDVRWDGGSGFMEPDVPYVFNFEYVIETKKAQPAINKIIVTGSGDFGAWKKKPLAVNLANNHILDLGDRGFEHTLSVLNQSGIAYFGAGSRSDNYNNPYITNIYGKQVAFLGYSDYEFLLETSPASYSCAKPTEKQIQHDMELCREKKADIVIVNIHWGREERPWYDKRQEWIGHRLIDAGAEIVIGHHPHCIQPIEVYHGKYIFYSLGNSYFPNLSVPSYFNKKGKSECKINVKNMKCGRESLRVQYDLGQGTVTQVSKLRYKKGVLKDCGEIKNLCAVHKIYRYPFMNEMTGYFRRICILLRSNFFVDGTVINWKALQKEVDFLRAKQKREYGK